MKVIPNSDFFLCGKLLDSRSRKRRRGAFRMRITHPPPAPLTPLPLPRFPAYNPSMPDAIIIGAGPAGCVAAILLARGRWDVCLVEQHRFPRDKVCGECLSALGYEVIERLGLSESFHELSPVRLIRSLIHSQRGATTEVQLPRPMWGVSRMRMDQWLLETAKRSGVRVIQPARCESLSPRGANSNRSQPPTETAGVVIRHLETNQIEHLSAPWILLADGKAALLPRRPAATSDLGIKAHFQNLAAPRDAIELFGVQNHYGGIAPIEGGLWNVAFSVPRARVQDHRGELDAMFDEIQRENKVLKDRFRGAKRHSAWMASPLPRFSSARSWPGGIIPLGNAAAAIEPVGGEGMGLAMRSAELAAEMLLPGSPDLCALRRSYQRLWQTRSLTCRATARIVSNPALSKWIEPSLRHAEPLGRVMMRMMGKG